MKYVLFIIILIFTHFGVLSQNSIPEEWFSFAKKIYFSQNKSTIFEFESNQTKIKKEDLPILLTMIIYHKKFQGDFIQKYQYDSSQFANKMFILFADGFYFGSALNQLKYRMKMGWFNLKELDIYTQQQFMDLSPCHKVYGTIATNIKKSILENNDTIQFNSNFDFQIYRKNYMTLSVDERKDSIWISPLVIEFQYVNQIIRIDNNYFCFGYKNFKAESLETPLTKVSRKDYSSLKFYIPEGYHYYIEDKPILEKIKPETLKYFKMKYLND